MSTLITNTLQGINTIKYDASTTALNINSSGTVTSPKMVAFSCTLNADHTHTTSSPAINKVTGWTVRTSNGTGHRINSTRISGFDATNSRFVAPVAGLYCHYYKPDYDRTLTTNHYVSFGVNGGQRDFDVVEDQPQYSNSGCMYACLLELQENDYVELFTRGGTTYGLRGTTTGHQYHTMWYGYLIG